MNTYVKAILGELSAKNEQTFAELENQIRIRLDQFQFCIDRVAHALGDVCCGGVDSSPEDQLKNPQSTTRVLCDAVASLKQRIVELEAEVKVKNQSFDLHWAATMRAIKRWQEATGKNLVWPSHEDLVVWLMEQLDAAKSKKVQP